MSALAILAALYPPIGDDRWHTNINWRPIPVHTKPQIEDPVLAMKKPCRKYRKMMSRLYRTPFFRELDRNHSGLYRFLSENTGENVTNIDHVEPIQNALEVEMYFNKTLPDWTRNVSLEILEKLANLRFQTPCYTPELARMTIGLLLGEILKHFYKFTGGQEEIMSVMVGDGGFGFRKRIPHKMLLYSAHDSTIANVLQGLGVFDGKKPTFSNVILFELKRKMMDFYVEIFYKSGKVVKKIDLEKCAFGCSFKDFERTILPIVMFDVQQWEKECQE